MEQTAADSLGSVRYVVLGAYLLMLLAFGVAGYRKSQNNEEDYYLAGPSSSTVTRAAYSRT